MKGSVITAKSDAAMYLRYLEHKIEDYAAKGDVDRLKHITIGMQILLESAWWHATAVAPLPPH